MKSDDLINSSPIVLSPGCGGPKSTWNWTNGFWMQSKHGKCIHPLDSDVPAFEGKEMVLYEGCGGAVIEFELVEGKYHSSLKKILAISLQNYS